MGLRFTENKNRSSGLSVTTNPRTAFSAHGLAEATQAQAEGGTITGKYMSPLRTAQAIAALSDPVRTRLTADKTYYVRTDGSNSNNGEANTAGGAWLTINYGIQWLRDNIDVAGYKLVLQVGDGTYTSKIQLFPILGVDPGGWATSQLVLRGNTTTLGNVLQSVTGDNALEAINNHTAWRVEGFEFRSTTGKGVLADFGSTIYLGKNKFGACNIHIQALYGGKVEFVDDYTVSGAAAVHWYTASAGQILVVAGKTVTISGTPAFSSCFAAAFQCSVITAVTVTFSGSATGVRFLTTTAGGINTNGGGANYLPGDSAGTATSPGWYA